VEALRETITWVTHHMDLTVGFVSVWFLFLAASLWAVRYFLISIPADYFTRTHQPLERWQKYHPLLRWLLLIGKNLIGVTFVGAGIVMLFTPGQGVLSILLGLSLVDFPGKRALERRIVARPAVLKLVNAMRARADRPPLEFDGPEQPQQ